MPYCTVHYLNSMAAHIDIDGDSTPSAADVEIIISSIDAQMDARFKAVGVATPITDSTLLEIVKPISAHGTLAVVYRSMGVEPEAAATFQDLYDKAMDKIEKRPSILSTGTTESAAPTGTTARYNDADPPFERGVTQW